MCPMCFANAMLIAGSVTSAGWLAFVGIRRIGGNKSAADENRSRTSRASRPERGAGHIVTDAK